ncbi:MAG TPA: cytochrome c [Gemmatimonadales bacterium]|nr:cytochrome c [Gemmatimonadales bacterium]
MQRILRLVACAALWASSLAAQGDSLYSAWCARCHGAEARGTPAASVRTDVPPADLAKCAVSTAETEDQWVDVVAQGGGAFGLSLDMPAYGESATPEQIRMVVRYVRSLCREPGWPPGELNFPRAFLVEKAYPENELVITAQGRGQEIIYERRAGRRLQFEAAVSTLFDSLDRPFDHATAAVKYNVWHDLERRAIASIGLETSPPLGRRDLWELEPFISAGWQRPDFIVQAEVATAWEETEGIADGSLRLGIARDMDRFVPMVEAGWDWARGAPGTLTLYPQTWIRLSRLGHVAGSIGVGVPVNGPERGHVTLTGFLLWDFGDGSLFRGW